MKRRRDAVDEFKWVERKCFKSHGRRPQRRRQRGAVLQLTAVTCTCSVHYTGIHIFTGRQHSLLWKHHASEDHEIFTDE